MESRVPPPWLNDFLFKSTILNFIFFAPSGTLRTVIGGDFGPGHLPIGAHLKLIDMEQAGNAIEKPAKFTGTNDTVLLMQLALTGSSRMEDQINPGGIQAALFCS